MNLQRLVRFAVLSCLVGAGSALAAPAGYFHDVSGDVTLTPAGKPPVKVAVGDLFESGARVSTGATGKVTLKFEDGEVVALAPNTDFTVTNYVFDKSKPAEGNILLNITRGGMRFVTGLIGKTRPGNFSVRTPTVTAGVRGSEGELIISGDGPGGTIQVLAGSSEGQIVIRAANGQEVVLSPGNFSFIPGNGAPSQPFTAGNAPPAAQALLNAVAALLQTILPAPTPVNATDAGNQRKSETGSNSTGESQSAPSPAAQQANTLVTGAGGGGGGTASPTK